MGGSQRLPPQIVRRRKTLMRRNLIREDRGQDVTEYSLLLAFVVVISAAIFIINTESIHSVWGQSSTTLSAASSVAAS